MRRLLRWLIALLVLGGLALAATWLARSETGLQWGFRLLQARLPGHLTADHVGGRLIGPLTVSGLRYDDDTVSVAIERLALDWQPVRLLGGSAHLTDLSLEGVEVTVHPQQQTEPDGHVAIPTIRLPLAIGVERLAVHRTRIVIAGHDPFVIDDLGFSGIARDSEVRLATLRASGPALQLEAGGRVPLSDSGPLELHARLKTVFDGRAIEGEASATGSPRRIVVAASLSSPVALRLDGLIDDGGEVPRWQFQAEAAPFALRALLPDARPLRLDSATLEARGRGLDVDASAHLTVTDEALGSWKAQLDGRWNSERWQISSLLLDGADGAHLEASGGGPSTDLAHARHQLDVSWRSLGWPLDHPGLVSPRGNLSVAGSLDGYRFELNGELVPPGTPPLALQAQGHGGRDAAMLDQVNGQWLNGEWSGSGRVALRPEPRWEFALAARHLGLESLNPALKSSLDAGLSGAGILHNDFGFDIRLERLEGTLRDRPVGDAGGVLAFHQGELALDGLALRSGNAALRADLRLGGNWQSGWRLDAPDLGDLLPGAQGSLHLSGQLDRPQEAFRVRVEAQADHPAYGSVRADGLQLSADVDFSAQGQWKVSAQGSGVAVADAALGRVMLQTEGTSEHHSLILRGDSAALHFEQRLSGSLAEDGWQAELRGGEIRHTHLGLWQQRMPTALTISGGSFSLSDYCLAQDQASACLHAGRADSGAAEGRLSWRQVDLARVSPLFATLTLLDLTGLSDGSAVAHYQAGRLHDADLEVQASNGAARYYIPSQENLHLLSYQNLRLSARATPGEGLRSELEVRFSATERLTADAELPGWDFGALELPPSQPVAGALELHLNDLSAVSLLVPDLSPDKGSIDGHLRLGGTVGSPRLDSDVHIAVSSVALPRLGTRLTAVALQVDIEQNRLKLQGSAKLGDGALKVDGSGAFDGPGQWNAQLHLAGDKLEAIRLPALQIVASPDINLTLRPGDLAFDGRLTIPKARVEPISPEVSVSPSSDVVVIGTEQTQTPPPRLRLHGSIEFVLGDEVKLSGRGLEGRLTGRLLVLSSVAGDVTAQGEIQFVDGRYRAYGQNLTIKQGRLLYAGGPLDNPALNIVASRQRGDQGEIEVGVRVMGTVQQPQVELFSSPAMDDTDILAYLVLGRPLDQVRQGEGQQLYQSANSVALVGGEALAERIAQRFDLVEISVETSDTSTDTNLVLGRALSPRLYVRYLQGLVEGGSAVQFRYRLSDRWTLETESGTRTGEGGDLLYTYEH